MRIWLRFTPAIVVATLAVSVLLGCRPPVQSTSTQPTPVAQKPTEAKPTAQPKPAVKPAKPDPSAAFFESGKVPELRVQLTPENAQSLRTDPRKYVPGTLVEDGKTTYKSAWVKLKGAAGSYRDFDDRPALTLNMKREGAGGEKFHGLDKFHLNNSVQDESYLNEWLCADLCRDAGCPAARVAHARVWVNGRDLGFYVLKEGFDKTFLARHFEDATGNLYDGGFLRDIDQDLERDEGEGPADFSDLKALTAACRENDPAKRWAAISARLDVPAFLNFMALEFLTCHWDGYAQNRNNYRVYFRPSDGRAVFLPHGMDQMFGDPNFPVFQHPGPIVPNALLNNPEWRAMYLERVKELLPLFAAARLNKKVDAMHDRLRPALAAMHEERARAFDGQVTNLKNLLSMREASIRAQLKSGPPEPLKFGKDGVAKIEEWGPMSESDAQLEEREVEGRKCYVIEVGASRHCIASWRRKVLLAHGSYRFEARAKVANVAVITDEKGKGFGLRLSGGMRANSLAGTTKWETVSFPFEILEDQREVDLVAELRATAGRVEVDAGSLQLVRVK